MIAGQPGARPRLERPLEVLVVDDSAVVRQLLTGILSREPDMRVTTAADAIVAAEKMRRLRPDVILLDLEMPRMDGLTFLRKVMAEDPVAVVVCSGFAEPGSRQALRALEAGAVDIVLKPRVGPGGAVEDGAAPLLDSVRAAAHARVQRRHPRGEPGAGPRHAPPSHGPAAEPPGAASGPAPGARAAGAVVAIGASTGGTEAISEILKEMPAAGPGIVIVQHMPRGFTALFAERLDELCRIEVKEARPGDRVQPGRALIAPGDRHMVVRGRAGTYVVDLVDGPAVCRHRPSVDVLFRSVADAAGAAAVGVILTGMGADGAEGLFAMRRAGAHARVRDARQAGRSGAAAGLDQARAQVRLSIPLLGDRERQMSPEEARGRLGKVQRVARFGELAPCPGYRTQRTERRRQPLRKRSDVHDSRQPDVSRRSCLRALHAVGEEDHLDVR
jgi:two-component system chemotaxis response regulator CheB